LGLRTIPWSNLVQEIAGLLTSAINQKRQKLDIDRLQRHQVAVSMMQLELLHQLGPADVYSLLVRILQEQTDILGAVVFAPEPSGSLLRVQAAAAQSDRIRDALLRLTPSRDATDYPLGHMPSSRAFRSAQPQGPLDPHEDTNLLLAIGSDPALMPVRAVVAYPLLEEGQTVPTAVLVVTGTDTSYFTPALLALLDHLVASVRLALGGYRTHRQIDRYRAFYEAFARASQAISRRSEPLQLFRNICDILTEYIGVPLAFISLAGDTTMHVVAAGGSGRHFLNHGPMGVGANTSELDLLHAHTMEARGPWLFETREQWLCNEEMRRRARDCGLESALTISWDHKDGAAGILGIIAGESGFFDRDMMRLIEAFAHDISFAVNDYERQQELVRLSLFDPLTDLPNRAYFERATIGAMARAARNGRVMALGIMDLDGFKKWNDIQGHRAGDDLLRAVAARLREVVREDEGVARLGGDEFGLAVTLDDIGALATLSARLIETVAHADGEKRVTASLGWAVYGPGKTDYASLLARADEALYAAKDGGRDTYRVFDGEIAERLGRRMETHHRFPRALASGQIFFLLQPQVSCTTGKVEGVELLARWRTPDGVIAATHFIPDIEKDPRLIRALGRLALTEAMALRARFTASGCPLRIAFNIGAHHFLHPDFLDEVANSLANARADGLCIEVTEHVALADIRRAAQVIEQLRTMGFSVALDDFGTGYSSLNDAAQLPVDELKLDQHFIRSFRRDPNAFAVASAVLLLCGLSGRRLVAEGIEELDDLTLWRHMGGDHVQGYLLSIPLAEQDLHEWLAAFEPKCASQGAVFPSKDLILVGQAFLEADGYAALDVRSMRAGQARLQQWVNTRRVVYSHLTSWAPFETTLQKANYVAPGAQHNFCLKELRPAVRALFGDMDTMLREKQSIPSQ
ncbi:MAG: putative bifunctional diguanylate cyclase/phosphodiesterase, partial [Acidiferrobacter sp.]